MRERACRQIRRRPPCRGAHRLSRAGLSTHLEHRRSAGHHRRAMGAVHAGVHVLLRSRHCARPRPRPGMDTAGRGPRLRTGQRGLRRLRPPAPVGTDVIGNNTATSAPPPAAVRPAGPPATTAPPGASTSTPAPAPSTVPGTATTPSAPATSDTLPAVSPGAAENPAPPPTSTPPEAGEPPLPAPAPPVTEQGGITKNTALPPNAPASEIAPTASTTPPPADDVRNNAWVTAQDAQRYTLQLVGSSDRSAALRYIRDRGITNDAAYYATSRDGQPWYVVIYGNYADRDAAQAALLHLPPTLRAASPWIRQFGDIQTHLAAP